MESPENSALMLLLIVAISIVVAGVRLMHCGHSRLASERKACTDEKDTSP